MSLRQKKSRTKPGNVFSWDNYKLMPKPNFIPRL
jgi:hypothetical protein